MPLIELLHASIAEVAVNCSSGCFRSSRRLDTHLSRPCNKGPAHPLATLRVSIWPNNKVVTWVLGPGSFPYRSASRGLFLEKPGNF